MNNESSTMTQENTTVNVKHVPERKVVYIDIDDEITSVYDRVKRQNISDIYLVVPKRAVVLQSVVNLKILKRKIEEIGKTLSIVTNDPAGIKLAKQANLAVYGHIKTLHKKSSEKKEEDAFGEIAPVKATSNILQDEAPCKIKQKKISIHQIVQQHQRAQHNVWTRFKFLLFSRKQTPLKRLKAVRYHLPTFSHQRGVISSLVILSIGVLLLITYIALPRATLYITPKSNVRSISVNVNLANYEKNKGELNNRPTHMIASYPVETTVSKTLSYQATGKEFNGSSAQGKITIVNLSTRVWPLVPKTRFQTEDGLVFRSNNYVNVPPKRGTTPGKIEIDVLADTYDINGMIIGDRGNIGPSRFFLPGLKTQESRRSLYAESYTPMSGGTSNTISFIIKEDFEAARMKITHEMRLASQSTLAAYVNEKGKADQTTYALLSGNDLIRFFEPSISIPYELEKQKQESFQVTGTMLVYGTMYNREEFLNILKRELRNSKSPDKKLLTIDEESVSYQIIENNEKTKRVKLTAQIKGIEEYEIAPEEENGKRLIENILSRIAGMNKEEAQKRLLNMAEIDKVEMDITPFWLPSLPKVAEHIEVKIVH